MGRIRQMGLVGRVAALVLMGGLAVADSPQVLWYTKTGEIAGAQALDFRADQMPAGTQTNGVTEADVSFVLTNDVAKCVYTNGVVRLGTVQELENIRADQASSRTNSMNVATLRVGSLLLKSQTTTNVTETFTTIDSGGSPISVEVAAGATNWTVTVPELGYDMSLSPAFSTSSKDTFSVAAAIDNNHFTTTQPASTTYTGSVGTWTTNTTTSTSSSAVNFQQPNGTILSGTSTNIVVSKDGGGTFTITITGGVITGVTSP